MSMCISLRGLTHFRVQERTFKDAAAAKLAGVRGRHTAMAGALRTTFEAYARVMQACARAPASMCAFAHAVTIELMRT